MDLVRILRGVLLSNHDVEFKQRLFNKFVESGVVTDIADDKLESVCAYALTQSLSADGEDVNGFMLSIILTGIIKRKSQFFDRYARLKRQFFIRVWELALIFPYSNIFPPKSVQIFRTRGGDRSV